MRKLLVSLIVLVFAAAPASAQNLVVDGSFENFGASGVWTSIADDGEAFGAWTAHTTPPNAIWLLLHNPDSDEFMPDGVVSCHVGDRRDAASITQVVSGLQPGGTYEVSVAVVAYTGDVNHPGATMTITDLATGIEDLEEVTMPAPFDLYSVAFEYSSFEFVASNTELEIEIFNPHDYATQIDDVSIVLLVPPGPLVGTVTPLSDPMNVSEENPAGTAIQFSVVLDQEPGADVNVAVTPPDDDLTLNALGPDTPVNLTFTTANWNVPQTVTVKAVDDAIVEGTEILSVTMFGISSADPNFDNGWIPPVEITVLDNDGKQIFLLGAPSVEEGGASSHTDTYSVGLQQAPVGDVIINLVSEPIPCQITINGGTSAELIFTLANWDTAQTITVAAVDDGMFETDPHTVNIAHTVISNDQWYNEQAVPNMEVSITENDFRIWNFDDDVLLSSPSNSSFEEPVLAPGGSFINPDPNEGPFGPLGPGDEGTGMPIKHVSDGDWALMYDEGQSVPDGDNVLDMPIVEGPGQDIGYATRACEYLIEPGPVSYTFTVAVGLSKIVDPNSSAVIELWTPSLAEESETLASSGDVIADGLVPVGQWKDITVCVVIPADSPHIGKPIYMGVRGEYVQLDNWRLTLGNHPCVGCYGDIPEAEGDLNDDCVVNIADFAILASNYLGCLLYPECVTGW